MCVRVFVRARVCGVELADDEVNRMTAREREKEREREKRVCACVFACEHVLGGEI